MTRSPRLRPALRTTAATWGAVLALAVAAGCSSQDDGGDGADAPDGPVAPASYVALGDSFTAAPFVPNLVEAKGCYRSTANYPTLVATELGVEDFTDVSCSAADTTHMTRRQTTTTGERVAPQFTALTEETELVTLGIGGNDFDVFGTLIQRCPQVRTQGPKGAPCRDAVRADAGGGQDPLFSSIERTQRRVRAVVEEIQERSPSARVLLVNYPQIVPASGTCRALPLARGDYAYARAVSERLDAALRAVARQTDVELVDLWEASEGHDVCSDDPWVNGSETDLSAALEYHPFAAGQRAAADLVVVAATSTD